MNSITIAAFNAGSARMTRNEFTKIIQTNNGSRRRVTVPGRLALMSKAKMNTSLGTIELELFDRKNKAIDVNFGFMAFTTPPLSAAHSLDAKFTTTAMARELTPAEQQLLRVAGDLMERLAEADDPGQSGRHDGSA